MTERYIPFPEHSARTREIAKQHQLNLRLAQTYRGDQRKLVINTQRPSFYYLHDFLTYNYYSLSPWTLP